MSANGKWVIILIAHDDSELDPQVIKEFVPVDEDEHLAAFLRGGELLATLAVDEPEADAEFIRREFEKQCLR